MELRFESMGGQAHIRLDSGQRELERIREAIDAVETALTRFDPGSELSRLNRDPRSAVPASSLLCRFVLAARRAGERSGGLVDATLLRPLERLGYAESRAGVVPASLEEALAAAPPRLPAGPSHARAYARIGVDALDTVVRPPGIQLDSGGIAKGLAADIAADTLPMGTRYAISCGGDVALGGSWEVRVDSVWTGEEVHRLAIRDGGGVATSGIGNRIWRRPDGSFAHHLIDPATGKPAWTGLVAVTAVGASALEAETLAKTVLLSGPRGARRLLRRRGGVLQHDDGNIEVVPPPPSSSSPRDRPGPDLHHSLTRAC